MKDRDIHRTMALLKEQVRDLALPWLENMVNHDQGGTDPFKVLISCMLSLRTQDRTTGEASERLFRLAPDVHSLSQLPVKKIEKAIYPVGFYRTKAVRIRDLCNTLIHQYGSQVPDDLDTLLTLKGVGRKTANLVLTLGYKKPGICVDTHVHRITNRWGYVATKNPEQTEHALRKKLPPSYWSEINGLLVAYGQHVCKPVSPLCSRCSIHRFCNKVGVKKHR